MESKFLDPKNDVCFKRIFGTEKNKHILIHFLNNIIEKWCYFFKNARKTDEKDVVKIVGQDEVIEKAYEELNYSAGLNSKDYHMSVK